MQDANASRGSTPRGGLFVAEAATALSGRIAGESHDVESADALIN